MLMINVSEIIIMSMMNVNDSIIVTEEVEK